MKLFISVTSILAVTSSLSFAQNNEPKPTPFELFASKPSVEIVFSKQIASLESADAKAHVTALIIGDVADPTVRMRGVRFTLEDNAGLDHVYLDENQLASMKRDLAQVESGIANLKKSDDAPYRVMGTQSCWMPAAPVRIMCPSFAIGPDWSGLTLGALGGRHFEFPARRPSELAELIDRAIAVLASH